MTTRYVIRLIDADRYIKSYDPDKHAPGMPFPTGYAVGTTDVNEALSFASWDEALDFWNIQSTVTPLRPDGQPNKPLTLFSVEIEEIDL